jgi:ATP-dependent Clp protease adapter protein ClpS
MSINSFFGEGYPKEAMQRKRNRKSLNFPSMSSYPPANPRKELSDEEISKLVPEHICAVHFKVAKMHSAAHSEDDLFEGIGDADFSFIEGDYEEEYSVNNNISVDDDYHQTTMEFVIETLIEFFNYNSQTAVQITEDINSAGSAVVAVLPYEVAEQKGIEVTVHARSNNFPLQIKLEPETA